MKNRAIVFLLTAVLTLLSSALTAQNRHFEDNSTKKAKTVKTKTVKPKNQKNTAPLTVHSTSGAYATLLGEQQQLANQIETLSAALLDSKKSKAKKISKEINSLTNDIEIVERKLATYPIEIRDPNYQRPVEIDVAFNTKLDQLTELRISQTDPYADQISLDPELEELYRNYLKNSGYIPLYKSVDGKLVEITDETITYRIMIAISRQPIPSSTFGSMSDILEQRMPNGSIIYYQGAYKTKDEANEACSEILSRGKARDSFVVAMRGGNRIPLPN